jgi:cell division protein FtsB
MYFPMQEGRRGGRDSAMRKRNYIKANRSSWTVRKKRMLIAASILLALYLLTSFILGEMGFVKYYRMKAQYNTLTEEISTLKQDNARLVRDVHALRSDPACIERIARDKLGLARQGEIVYYYGEP